MAVSNPPGTTVHRKPNGVAYLYTVESYWDKDKKAPRNKQVCLGRYNEETGEVTPSGRAKKSDTQKPSSDFKAATKVYGPYLLLMKLANDIGLTKILKKCLPNIHERVLSLVFYIVQRGLALSRCEMWSENHQHPSNRPISNRQVSELLKQITEKDRVAPSD